MMSEPLLKKEASSVVHHNEINCPLTVEHCEFIEGKNYETLAHWHNDLELICVESGKMSCHVNEKHFTLKKGDILFINRKQLHHSCSENKKSCKYMVLLINPRVVAGERDLYEEYINPMLSDEGFRQKLFLQYNKKTQEIFTLVKDLVKFWNDLPKAWEMEVIALILKLFRRLYLEYISQGSLPGSVTDKDVELQRRMVNYIYENFPQHITLSEIAESAGVSRSKCCQIFRDYFHQSPIDFMNLYRLEVSRKLLKNTDESISDISKGCGFGHQSYYNRIFFRRYECTPREYRQKSENNLTFLEIR